MKRYRVKPKAAVSALLSALLAFSGLTAAQADTSGSGDCQQTFTKSGTGEVAVTSADGYCYVAFKNTGSLGSQTTYSWTKPSGVSVADVLVVGGGGGGGSRHGGGGGAGALVDATNYSLAGASAITVVVGAGGAGATGSTSYAGTSGQNSTFKNSTNGLTALGGGFGHSGGTSGSGGSGGGGGYNQTPGGATSQTQYTFAGGTLSGINFGNSGATGANDTNVGTDLNDYWAGGGGGGAGAAGAKPTSNGNETTSFLTGTSSTARGGNGGAGRAVTWLPTTPASALGVGQASSGSVYFAGGGGGGMGADGVAGGTGGVGGGANGTRAESTGNNGVANTGGGGGGSGFDDIPQGTAPNPEGGDGGSGIVVVRYSLTPDAPTSISTSNISYNSVQVSFTAPTHTPQAITGYQYSLNGGSTWLDAVQATSPLTITGLTSETSYSNVRIRAKSAAGGGTSATVSTFSTLKNPSDYLRLYFNSTDADSYDAASSSPNAVRNLGTTTLSGTIINGSNGAITLDSSTRAWNFPGGTSSTGSYIDLEDFSHATYRTSGITIDFEADFGSANMWERVIDFGNMRSATIGEVNNLFIARLGTDATLIVEAWGNLTKISTCQAVNAIGAGMARWTVRLDGTNCTIWKNGEALPLNGTSATTSAFGQLPDATVSNVFVGKSNWTADAQFEGKIRYLRIFQGSFTPAEIGTVNYNLVQFNKNGGNADPASLSTSGKIRVPQVGSVTRAGYTLSGWSDGSNIFAPGAIYIAPSGTTSLNAQWSPNTNNVTWDVNGGSAVSSSTFQTGGTLSKPSDPTRSGKVFGGWSTTETSNQGDLANQIASWPYSPPALSDITLYATWLEPCVTSQSSYVSGGRAYTVVKFASGTNCGWYVPENVTSIDVLAVGGGGGGGENVGTGGGGGGVYLTTSFTVSANAPTTISVGEGGLGGYFASQISSTSATADARRNGADGTSSSFAISNTVFTAGGGSKGLTHWGDLKCSGTSEQSNVSVPGGIGGGAGANGGVGGRAPSSTGNGSNGGAGVSVDFFGTGSVIYGAGGGGGGWSGTGGLAGNGVANSGAGNGASSSGAGSNGIVNRGGGGGGGEVHCGAGGNGGSGLVAIRYSFASFEIQYLAGSGATGSGQTANKTAGVSLSLASDASANSWFTKAGQRVIGWSTTDDGTVDYRFGHAYTSDSAQTLYAVWAPACSPTIETFASGSSAYQVYKFNSTGYCTWTVPAGVTSIDALLVAGGGGGGGGYDNAGGGGGGGGQVISQSAVAVTPASNLTIFVGAGGQGGTAVRSPVAEYHGTSGKNSEIFTDASYLVRALGGDGGSRSRADYISPARSVGTAGLGASGSTPAQGGFRAGGGGAGGAGSGVTFGPGVTSTFSGTSIVYGAGGQGGTNTVGANGANGAANTGKGGGGASAPSSSDWDGGSGGSGTIILRHSINAVTVTYNYNGADGGTRPVEGIYNPSGSAIVLPSPTKTNFTLSGWYSDSNLTSLVGLAGDNYTPTQSQTIYAKWLSKNTNLSGLTIGAGTLSPSFNSSTLNYTTSVGRTVSSITVSPTASEAGSVIRINSAIVNSGSSSNAISLAVGANTISIVVTAEDGVTTKSYSVRVTRSGPQSHDEPGFAGTAVTWSSNSYFDSYASRSGVVTTDASDTNNMVWQLYYAHQAISIPADAVNRLGINTRLSGSNSWTWWFTASTNRNDISSFSTPVQIGSKGVSYSGGGFNESVATSTVNIAANTYFMIGVSGGPYYRSVMSSANRTATSNGTDVVTSMNTVFLGPWPYGTSRGIPVALGGSTADYNYSATPGQEYLQYDGYQSVISVKFKYTGQVSTDSALVSLALTNGGLSPTFSKTIFTYSASVAANTASITVTPTVNNAGATVTVNGSSVTSGSASGAINLNYGLNTISVVVTAQDLSTSTYRILVTRANPVYTITYDKNGATGVPERASESYTLSASAIVLPLVGTMARSGYSFGGWSSVQNDATTKIVGSYTPTQSITLYALWLPNQYSYSYNVNAATSGTPSVTSGTYTTGGTAITLATRGTMERTGYSFDGWSTTQNDASTKVLNSGSYTISAPVILYAIWTANNYTVSYSVTGADSGTAPTDSANYNISQSAVVKANTGNLVKAGYTFAGWTTESNGSGTIYQSGSTYQFGAASVTFYPKFTPNTYTITYNTNGATGTPAGGSTTSYTTGNSGISLANVGTMAKTGYDFAGWSTNPTGSAHSGGFTTTQDVTLYAIWTLKDIAVTYNRGAISGTNLTSAEIATFPSNTTGKYGARISLSPTVSSTITFGGNNYQFFGWSDGNSTFRSGDSFTLTEVAPTFTAQWARLYAVRYALNGGTGIVTIDSECTQVDYTCLPNAVITLSAAPSRDGYQFTGWKDQSNNSYAAGDSFTVTDTKYLLYAQWQAIDYTMSFDSAGGSNSPSSLTKNIGQSFEMPNPGTRAGYDFVGWSDGSVSYGTGVTYNVGVGNKSFTAIWNPKTYLITYNWNGGSLVSGSAIATVSYTVGNAGISLPNGTTYARDGYVFDGWSLTNGGTKLSGAFTPTETGMLYARWLDGEYEITYNARGGSVSRARDNVTRSASVTLPTPTRAGFTFEGWYDDSGLTRKIANGGATHQPDASRAMYAKWTQNSLVGINPAHLNTLSTTTVTGAHSWSGDHALSGTGAALNIPNGALEAGTVVNVSFVDDLTRPRSLIDNNFAYYTSVVVHWLKGTGDNATVPNTAANKPITLTLTNPNIKVGSKVFMIVNGVATEVATATQDGQVTVSMTQDPEFVVAATRPDAPTNVVATAGNTQATVSWTASNSGGSDITGYTVTASGGGGTCTTTGATSCVVTGLTNGTAYTFTVTATNAIGTSNASSASAAVTPALATYTVTFNSNGGSSVANGSFPAGGTVAQPTSPTKNGFTFAGWSTLLNDASTAVSFPYSPSVSANITLYALWTAVSSGSSGGSSSGGGSVTNPVVTVPIPSPGLKFDLPSGTVRQVVITGENLQKVVSVKIAGSPVVILKRTSSQLILKLPRLKPGSYSFTLDYGQNIVTEQMIQISEQVGPKVNAGSFKGYVAIFAKDYVGKRLSAKVGKTWVVLPKVPADFARSVILTGTDVELNVRIYIDRKLVDTVYVYTH